MGVFGKQFFSLGINILLIRALTPKIFGLVGMILTFTAIADAFRDFGLSAAIIQKKQSVSELQLSTIFWINVLIGFVLCLILLITAGTISLFYNEEVLLEIIPYFSMIFIIESLRLVHNAIMKRKMKFKQLAFVDLLSLVISGSVGVILAFLDFGVYSLIIKSLLYSFVALCLSIYFERWFPMLKFKLSAIKELFGFSFYIFLNSIASYSVRNIDKMLIGANFGPSVLGIYERAYNLMLVPVRALGSMFSNVFFSYFSKNQDKNTLITNVFYHTLAFIILFIFPLLMLIALNTKGIVSVLFGEKWIEMSPILAILTFAGMLQLLSIVSVTSIISLGRARLLFYFGLVTKAIILISIFIGVKYDTVTLSKFYLIANIINTPIIIYFSCSVIGSSLGKLFNAIKDVLLFPMIFAGIILCLKQLDIFNDNTLLQLITISVISGLLYTLMIRYLNQFRFRQLLSIINPSSTDNYKSGKSII